MRRPGPGQRGGGTSLRPRCTALAALPLLSAAGNFLHTSRTRGAGAGRGQGNFLHTSAALHGASMGGTGESAGKGE